MAAAHEGHYDSWFKGRRDSFGSPIAGNKKQDDVRTAKIVEIVENVVTVNVDTEESRQTPDRVTLQCPKCPKTFSRASGLNYHVAKIHEGLTIECSICKKSFLSKSGLNSHISVVHNGGDQCQCTKCGKTFTTKRAMELHVNSVHEGIKPFGCDKCSKTFGSKEQLKKHVAKIHEAIKALYIFEEIC